MEWLKIVAVAVLACVIYGVIHDQFTARICVEYFTIGHAPIFGTEDPTLLALGWGVLATWWVGILLGVPLAAASRAGRRPPVHVHELLRPIGIVGVCTAALATLAGIVGYFAASAGVVILLPGLAERVPEEKHVPFLVDLWIHNASYCGGFLGGLLLIAWVWHRRIQRERQRTN